MPACPDCPLWPGLPVLALALLSVLTLLPILTLLATLALLRLAGLLTGLLRVAALVAALQSARLPAFARFAFAAAITRPALALLTLGELLLHAIAHGFHARQSFFKIARVAARTLSRLAGLAAWPPGPAAIDRADCSAPA